MWQIELYARLITKIMRDNIPNGSSDVPYTKKNMVVKPMRRRLLR